MTASSGPYCVMGKEREWSGTLRPATRRCCR
jgi:hypothetical protein